MKFKSAVDRWYYMTIVLSLLVVAGVVIPEYLSKRLALPEAALVTLLVCLPVWLYFSTYYLVVDERLVIRTGIFTWKIPLAEIHSATASRSLLSSPALSLDRIEIRYGNGKRILVSPEQPEVFLRAIGQ